ncbi:UNVERIFIED_CONTAM: hypothetical protein GTU68_017206 [Idotea baltica]|jgi:hypothetical protein
MSRLR